MPCVNHPEIVTGLTACARCGRDFCGDCIITLRGQPVCAGCKNEQVQDIKSGASAGLELASRGARLGAAIVDTLIAIAVVMPIVFLSGGFDPERAQQPQGLGVFLVQNVLPGAIMIAYEALMLAAYGQTLGKMALKIKVVRLDETPISTGQAWGRAVSRGLMGMTQILGIVDALMIFSKTRATLHDRIAKTAVVNWKR